MRRSKLTFVSLLSLLIVLAPVSSVLAQNEPVEKPVNEKSQQTKQKAEKDQTSVFEEIEKQGGNEVTDKKLDQEEGEGWLGAAVGAVVGAVAGASWYSATHLFSWSGRECGMAAAEGAFKGALVTGVSTSVL